MHILNMIFSKFTIVHFLLLIFSVKTFLLQTFDFCSKRFSVKFLVLEKKQFQTKIQKIFNKKSLKNWKNSNKKVEKKSEQKSWKNPKQRKKISNKKSKKIKKKIENFLHKKFKICYKKKLKKSKKKQIFLLFFSEKNLQISKKKVEIFP